MVASFNKYIDQVEAGFPLTRYPKTVPKVQDKIVSRITCCPYKGADLVGIALGPDGVQYAHGDSLMFIQDHLNDFNKALGVSIIIPKNALTVSYAILNFVPGKSCQEFYPKDREMPADAFFTYRMLSKHCQATFYNEGGVEFLAGLCYYLQLKRSFLLTTHIDKQALAIPVGSNIPYPLSDRWETWRFKNYKYYGRDCKAAGKRVQVYLADGKDALHRFFNFRTMKYEFAHCAECREEAKTYKFVPKKVEEKKKVAKPEVTESEKKEIAAKEEVKEEPVAAAATPIEKKLEAMKFEDYELASDDSDYDLAEDLYG